MSNKEIKFIKIEKMLGYKLPEYFKKFYMEHDDETINNYGFLKLDEILDEMNMTDDREIEEELESEPENAIQKRAYSTKRLPFITDFSGNYVGMDFAPGEQGTIGQVISYGADEYKMVVFANTFKDFIEGIMQFDYNKDIYVTDYLNDNGLRFLKEVPEENLPKQLESNILQSKIFTEEQIHEFQKEIDFNENILNKIIDIIDNLKVSIRNDVTVIKQQLITDDYRIKNFRDSLSRTMQTKESFWEKLLDYDKSGIKGYSFSIKMKLEVESDDNIKKIGNESIFVDIDKDKVLVRYRATINEKNFENAYNQICEIF